MTLRRTVRATTRSSASSPQPTADDRAAHHNEVIQAGMRRADELEPRLAAILEPILRQAGMEAAHLFETQAVDWLAASGIESRGEGAFYLHYEAACDFIEALALKPNNGPAGSPGIRTPNVTSMSTMVALIPRADEAAALEHQQIPADELHVTLCFLGEVEGDLAPVVAAVAQAASAHAPLEGKVAGIAAFEDTGNGNPSIVLPSVPGLTELRVAVTEALAARGIDYSREYGYVPHATVAYGTPSNDNLAASGEPSLGGGVAAAGELHGSRNALHAEEHAGMGSLSGMSAGGESSVSRQAQVLNGLTFPDSACIGQPLHFDSVYVVRGNEERHEVKLTGATPITASSATWYGDFKSYATMFGLPGDDDGVADESPTAEHPGKNLPVPANDPAAMGPPSSVGYRTAATEGTSCATCSYYSPGTYYRCGRFDVFVDPGMVCNAFDQALVDPIDGQDDWTEGDDMIGELLAAGDDAPTPVTLTAGDKTQQNAITAAGGKSTPAPDELVNVDKLVKQLRTKTDPVRVAVIQSVMAASLASVGLEWDATNPFVAKILAQTGSQIRNIAETTQLNVMRIIKAAYEEGLTIPDTAKAIRVGMKEASITRATLIARTELAGAVNGASVAATQIVSEATGVEYTKTWHTSVGATYPRHEDYDGLDGQTVGLDDYFDVGGFQLGFPGDPDGPPEEVCSCRCTVVYTEANGDQTEEDAG